MSSQGSSSSSSRGSGQHADTHPPRHATGPKLQVQRSLSRDTITIHFSALGKEEDDEEEELYGIPAGDKSELAGAQVLQGLETPGGDDQSVVTGLEAKEELLCETSGLETFSGAAVLPVSTLPVEASDTHPQTPSSAMNIVSTSTPSHLSSNPPASSSWPSDRPSVNPPSTRFTSASPCKSTALSSSKPFLSLVRSLSNDIESRETIPAPTTAASPHARHRHLMKSLVKSLSTDTSKTEHQEGPLHHHPHHPPQQQHQVQPSQRPPPRNMQLFKQFSQPRLPSCSVAVTHTGGDSKTAPSSPITSPDSRSFFKVQEVEARIEDTKRRLSEVMSDPMQLFSKIMGDEFGTAASTHRTKLLSSSASELTGVMAVNGHTEGNNNYSIKEEEGTECEEEETPTGNAPDSVFFSFPSLAPASAIAQISASTLPKSPSLTLGRCSMSALVARQEDEDFCELYSEDFELCTDTETPDGDRSGSRQPHTGSTGLCSELDTEEEEKMEEEMENVPVTGLIFLTQLVYLYLFLPMPPYVCAVVHGIVAGFAMALLVLWLSSPRMSSSGTRKGRRRIEHWNVAQLNIKDPGIFKVKQSMDGKVWTS